MSNTEYEDENGTPERKCTRVAASPGIDHMVRSCMITMLHADAK
jgi:hypothetical protein